MKISQNQELPDKEPQNMSRDRLILQLVELWEITRSCRDSRQFTQTLFTNSNFSSFMINMDLQLAIGNGVEIPGVFGNRAESNKNQIMSVLRQMKPKQSFVLPRLNLRNMASQAARELNLNITSRVMRDGQVRVWLIGDALTW